MRRDLRPVALYLMVPPAAGVTPAAAGVEPEAPGVQPGCAGSATVL